jgi:mono/diheme cytochrome c family protein
VTCIVALLLVLIRATTTAPATTESLAPGLILKFESNGITDARIARLAALAVSEGATVSTFLPPGPFHATFEGFINLKLRGDYVFSLQGRGAVELLINGQPVLSVAGEDLSIRPIERVRLKKGPNALLLKYAPPAHGDAVVRLSWSEKNQPPEPIPPVLFTHDPSDSAIQRGTTRRRGRELVEDLRCARCHSGFIGAPEAPSLNKIGSRLHAPWIARWVADPKSIRSDALMPQLVRSDADARDAAAYLASLNGAESPVRFEPDDVAVGAHFFTALGCVACHSESSLPLRYVPAKWKPAALVDYLREPEKRHPDTRMPNFRLADDEVRRLAAYLLVGREKGEEKPLRGDAARGRALVATSGCLNCHVLDSAQNELRAKSFTELSDLRAGCLGNSDRAPHFGLVDADRDAIREFIQTSRLNPTQNSPVDAAEAQIRRLNCVACHTRDAQTDAWSSLRSAIESIESKHPLGHEVLPMSGDQARPSLTWIGEKLRTNWMAKFIAGEIPYKPRPSLAARMPSFGKSRGKIIAEGFALEHGIIPGASEPEPPLDENLAKTGQKLVGRNGGFSCNACHAIGAVPPTSAFEAQGVNFANVHERMRFDFYTRWVRSPQHYEPGTRMPQYRDAQGKTALKEIEDGDADRQFRAIWEYLRAGEKIEPAE